MTPELTIVTALTKRATRVDALGTGRWAFAIQNGVTLAAGARVDDGWLVFDATLAAGPAAAARPWDWLAWNATLAGGARFVVRAPASAARVRAEVPLDQDIDVGRRIVEACTGLEAAQRLVAYGPEPAPDGAASSGVSLAALCGQTPWPVVERDGGTLAVELDVPGAFHQATIARRADGSVAVATPVVDALATGGGPVSSVCEEALGLLLVRVGSVVRMVRAALEPGDGAAPHFEVVFGSAPHPTELSHACAALSVACRLASREAAVLQCDEGVAQAYLTQWPHNNITTQQKED